LCLWMKIGGDKWGWWLCNKESNKSVCRLGSLFEGEI
jgi:hypothetical protein